MPKRQALSPQRVPTQAEHSMLLAAMVKTGTAMINVTSAIETESIFLSDTDLLRLMVELDMALLIVKDIRASCRTVED